MDRFDHLGHGRNNRPNCRYRLVADLFGKPMKNIFCSKRTSDGVVTCRNFSCLELLLKANGEDLPN
jgi:hypothetical protein